MNDRDAAMTPQERDAYALGLSVAANLLLLRASQIAQDVSPADLRVALLCDVAESTTAIIHARDTPADVEGLQVARDMVAEEIGSSGTFPCPACGGKLDWIAFDDQSRGWCRTKGCLAWLK